MSKTKKTARHPATLRAVEDDAQTMAAAAIATAAARIVFGPPTQLSSGTTARHASAPPLRSAP